MPPKGKSTGASSSSDANCFPIPLSFLYRDPRPARCRRRQRRHPDGNAGDDLLDDDETEQVTETEEQRREKKTLYWANMAQARALTLSHRYTDARDALTKALELQPGDKNALVCRSRCRILLGDTKGALEDAENALKIDQQFVKATYQKAEVLFQVGRFEEALVFYHTGVKQRPDMEVFQLGVRKAQEAIEVSLGVRRPNERRMQHHHPQPRTSTTTKKKCGTADAFRLPPLNLNRMSGGSGNAAHKTRRNGTCTARESSLLGDLHVDKLYLQKLLENPGLRNSNGSSQKILNHAKDALDYLKSREDFWRQQQPSTLIYQPIKEKVKTKKKRRVVPQSSRTTLTMSSDISRSTCEINTIEEDSSSSSSSSSSDSVKSLEKSKPDVGTPETPKTPETPETSETSETESADIVDADNHHIQLLRQIVDEMSECNKAEQLKQCLEIYLSHYWRRWGDTEASEASPDEMQRKTDELRSLAAQEETPPSIYRTNLAFNVATLQLVSGQEELSKSTAEEALEWAQLSSDWRNSVRIYLLLAAAAAWTEDAANVQIHLSSAEQLVQLDRCENALSNK